MKLLQIAFIALVGATCFATYATSKTLHPDFAVAEQAVVMPAPSDS